MSPFVPRGSQQSYLGVLITLWAAWKSKMITVVEVH